MAKSVGSTVPGRHLGRVLRALRTESGMTLAGAATALECSPQKVWRIEGGLAPTVRARDARAMCELYGARPELTSELVALAAQVGSKGWWHAHTGVSADGFDLCVGIEAAAYRLREYQSVIIPTLLQTPAYAAALFTPHPGGTDDERAHADETRRRRQSLLSRRFPGPPGLDVVLSEAALLANGGDPTTMSEQLHHLVETSWQPHISIRIVPLDAGAHPGSVSGPFVLIDFPPGQQRAQTEPSVVYREFLTGALYLDQEHEFAAYERVWTALDELALDDEESRHLIGKIREEVHHDRMMPTHGEDAE